MPVYDFHCPKCGLVFELTRSRNEAGDPALCPQDGTKSDRVWSSITLHTGEPFRERFLGSVPSANDVMDAQQQG